MMSQCNKANESAMKKRTKKAGVIFRKSQSRNEPTRARHNKSTLNVVAKGKLNLKRRL